MRSQAYLINTSLQRSVGMCKGWLNRFSGFQRVRKTAKAVQPFNTCGDTPLKRGVNEIDDNLVIKDLAFSSWEE